jgi:hypothetical protein
MEAKKCSSCTEENSQNTYLHGNSLLQNGINIPGKSEKSCQRSAKFVKLDKQRKHVSDVDTPSCDCDDGYLLTREQCLALNMSARRKLTTQQHLRNTESLESGKREIGPSDKSLWGEAHSYQQDTPKFPTVEQQLEHLIPSKELLLHYREKIVQLNNDYQALMERVDQ